MFENFPEMHRELYIKAYKSLIKLFTKKINSLEKIDKRTEKTFTESLYGGLKIDDFLTEKLKKKIQNVGYIDNLPVNEQSVKEILNIILLKVLKIIKTHDSICPLKLANEIRLHKFDKKSVNDLKYDTVLGDLTVTKDGNNVKIHFETKNENTPLSKKSEAQCNSIFKYMALNILKRSLESNDGIGEDEGFLVGNQHAYYFRAKISLPDDICLMNVEGKLNHICENIDKISSSIYGSTFPNWNPYYSDSRYK